MNQIPERCRMLKLLEHLTYECLAWCEASDTGQDAREMALSMMLACAGIVATEMAFYHEEYPGPDPMPDYAYKTLVSKICAAVGAANNIKA